MWKTNLYTLVDKVWKSWYFTCLQLLKPPGNLYKVIVKFDRKSWKTPVISFQLNNNTRTNKLLKVKITLWMRYLYTHINNALSMDSVARVTVVDKSLRMSKWDLAHLNVKTSHFRSLWLASKNRYLVFVFLFSLGSKVHSLFIYVLPNP